MTLRGGMPTLGPIVRGAREALLRFPLVLLAAALSAAFAIRIPDQLGDPEQNVRLLAVATLGIPLFVALALAGERRAWGLVTKVVVSLVAIGLLAWFAVAWGHWSEPVQFGRYVQASAACHLLVAFLPYVGRAERHGFWQYNRTLLERAIVGALYTVVLYAGAAIALAALDKLFSVGVPATGYVRLWFALGFVFNTWFFLGGVPRDFGTLEASRDYPAGIKAFTQYALLPIVAVYLVILTVYLVKVVVTWNWPSGWIGWLVSSVAAVGIFSLLLVYPVASEAANRWVTAYARWFYFALLPAIVMLWLAIWQRVEQYGITEPRYFLSVLSLWLAGIAVHALLTRSRNIKVIPASLCAVAVLTLFGPWSAYRVSESSQVGRLATVLERNGMLEQGRVRPAPAAIGFEDRKEISAILGYLASTHGTATIDPWFGDSLPRIDTVAHGTQPSSVGADRARVITAWLNVPYVDQRGAAASGWFSYSSDAHGMAVPVAGYDALLYVLGSSPSVDTSAAALDLRAVAGRDLKSLRVLRGDTVVAELPLDSLATALREQGYAQNQRVPLEHMRVASETAQVRVVLHVLVLSGRWTTDSLTISSFSGVLLVTLK